MQVKLNATPTQLVLQEGDEFELLQQGTGTSVLQYSNNDPSNQDHATPEPILAANRPTLGTLAHLPALKYDREQLCRRDCHV